jgi:hypothetical protein
MTLDLPLPQDPVSAIVRPDSTSLANERANYGGDTGMPAELIVRRRVVG